MIPSAAAEKAAIARQLLDALRKYEADVALLVELGLDPELAQRIGDQFDRMRMYSSELPALSVSWVELLISRFDMTQALWASRTGAATHRVVKLHDYHVSIIAEVRRKCLDYVEAGTPTCPPPDLTPT